MVCNDTSNNVTSPSYVPLARPIGVIEVAPSTPTDPMLLLDHRKATSWWDLLTLILLAMGLEAVMGLISAIVASPEGVGDPRRINILLVIIRGGLLVAAIVIIVRTRRQGMASLGLCSRRWWSTGLFGVVGAVAAFAAFGAVVLLIYRLYPAGYVAMQRNADRIFVELPKLHPVILCLIALCVGIYEEIIFRGFLLTRLRHATGSAGLAVVVSAALFAAPHAATQEHIAVVPILMLGLVWAVLTLWRRSVIPAIIAHALFDATQLMYLYFFNPHWES